MSENTSFTPFEQVPVWKEDAVFTLTAQEFTAIRELCDSYSNLQEILINIFQRHMDSGIITVLYKDKEGNDLTLDQVQEMVKEMYKQQTQTINHNKSIIMP